MIQYFAMIRSEECWGPFDTFDEAVALLRRTSQELGHTSEQAYRFFLEDCAIQQIDTANDSASRFHLELVKREICPRLPPAPESRDDASLAGSLAETAPSGRTVPSETTAKTTSLRITTSLPHPRRHAWPSEL